MTNTLPMLITKINEYINDKEKQKIVYNAYNIFEFREFHDFQADNRLSLFTIKRGLILIRNLFYLQLLLDKNIHFPGIGLFSIYPSNYNNQYNFPETLQKMSIVHSNEKKILYDNIVGKIITDENKLDFKALSLSTFQLKLQDKEKFSFIVKFETKINYINESIKTYLNLPDLKVINTEQYTGGKKFKDIVKNYNDNSKDSIKNLLELINLEDLSFNMKILEDLLILIGYIENNKDKFDLKK